MKVPPGATAELHFFLVDATDFTTPETGEAGGQPQIRVAGGSFTNTGVGTLVDKGSGHYAAVVEAGTVTAGAVIEGRYKSAATAEAPSLNILEVETLQTGDAFARLGAPAGASVSADVATAKAVIDSAEEGAWAAEQLARIAAATLAATGLDGNPVWQPFLVMSTTGTTTRVTVSGAMVPGAPLGLAANVFRNWTVSVSNGDSTNQVREILSHTASDLSSEIVLTHDAWTVNPLANASMQLAKPVVATNAPTTAAVAEAVQTQLADDFAAIGGGSAPTTEEIAIAVLEHLVATHEGVEGSVAELLSYIRTQMGSLLAGSGSELLTVKVNSSVPALLAGAWVWAHNAVGLLVARGPTGADGKVVLKPGPGNITLTCVFAGQVFTTQVVTITPGVNQTAAFSGTNPLPGCLGLAEDQFCVR